ncbi:hypothetical protein Droror1_Dr00020652 [Drosera rotundifolia]
MSAIGFDIGNENCVIAAVKQRLIDVLLNDESKRETPAVVSFGEKQRFLGAAGAAMATMSPKSTISQLKRLIGRSFSEPDVQDDLRLFPFETSQGPDGGILIHLQYMGGKHTFTPVQVLAMLLSHLKQIAEKGLETPVSDCVIGIPSYFTELPKRHYLDAATIADLIPLRLMHECTAIALGYGIYKMDLSRSSKHLVVFVDIGHSDTQVAVASFEPGQMKVLSHAFDRNLGGRNFDEVLFRHFAAQFKEQYAIDVYSNVRASTRLRAACEKLKKVLSANAEAPLHIECLMDEKDVKGYIKREEFEKLSSELLERLRVPCEKAVIDAGLTVGDIHLVELVGSGSRIPAITRILASFFRREPSRTVNASECVARGCALQCAMLSPTFRVRDYEVQDSLPFSIGFSSDEGPIHTHSTGVLFPKGHPIPSIKMLTLRKHSMFHLEAYYTDKSELPPGVSPKISIFTIGPFQASNPANARVKVKVQLNLHGIVTLESATLLEDHMDESIGRSAEAFADEMEAEFDHEHAAEYNSHAKGMSRIRQEIPISETVYGGMTRAEVSEAQEREFELAQQDDKVEQAKDKKNALESFVYETRSKILGTLRSFASDLEKEDISHNLQQTEEWLYEDGDDETEDVYREKLQDLKQLLDPIENRYKDEEARAQAIRDLLKCIADNRAAAASLPSHSKDAVLTECYKTEQWLNERSQEQNSLPKNVDPILWSSEIRRKLDALDLLGKQAANSKTGVRSDQGSKDEMQVD